MFNFFKKTSVAKDEETLIQTLNSLGILDKYRWESIEYLNESAIKLGAIKAYTIRGLVDIYFDKQGNFVGSSTHSRGSFKKADKDFVEKFVVK